MLLRVTKPYIKARVARSSNVEFGPTKMPPVCAGGISPFLPAMQMNGSPNNGGLARRWFRRSAMPDGTRAPTSWASGHP